MSASKRRSAKRGWRKFERLQEAVIALYSAAMWLPDRYVENEMGLWTELRDAAGIEAGTKSQMIFQPGERIYSEEER